MGAIDNLTPEEREYEQQAIEGVERYRKGDAVLSFEDAAGEPLCGLPVRIKLIRHAFRFGGWPWPPHRSEHPRISDQEARRLYDEHYTRLFNVGTAMMYWDEKPGFPRMERRQAQPDHAFLEQLIRWSRENRIPLKGHPLVWSKPNAVPDWIGKGTERARDLLLEARVRNLVAGFKGTIDEWDVVNETIWESTWPHIGKRPWPVLEEIADIVRFAAPLFRWAREENPAALLLINDYGLEYDLRPGQAGFPTAALQRRRYRDVIEGLLDTGCGPDAIGLQVHEPAGAWFGPKLLWSLFDEFAQSGLPLHLTEVIPGRSRGPMTGFRSGEWTAELEKAAYQQFYRLAFGHPAVDALICYTTLHEGYTYSGTPNGVYEALDELINGEWRTELTMATDERGQLRFRGFYGDYELLLPGRGGRQHRLDYRLSREVRSEPVFRLGDESRHTAVSR